MIKSFNCSETSKILNGQSVRKLSSAIQNMARRKLRMINNAKNINDLRVPPASRLELLGADRAGQHSIRINGQWRICFVWNNGAENVEIADYR